MPDSKKTSGQQAAPSDTTDLYAKALEVGYFGESPKSIPNEHFSLKTGPESPSAAAQIVDAQRAQLEVAEKSLTNTDPKKG